MLGDMLALVLGALLAWAMQLIVRPVPWPLVQEHSALFAASLPGFAIGAVLNHLYLARANESRFEEAKNILKSVGVGLVTLLTVAFAVQYDDLSRFWIISTALFVSVALLVERRFARAMFSRMRTDGRLKRRIVIVGTDAHACALATTYQRDPALGYEVVGFAGTGDIDDPLVDDPDMERLGVLGTIDQLDDLLDAHDAVGVVVSLASVDADHVNVLTRRLTDCGYHVALSSSLRDIDVTRLRPQALDGRTMIYVEPVARGGWQASAKRLFDVSLALTLLVSTLPIQIASALAIALTSKGPVFFRQIRVGRDGELFEVLKFRTMYADAEERKAALMEQNEADGPLFKMKDDPRVTPVGRTLRKLSIDELPQLFCVLIGSMSMVGPRPALPSEVEQWDDDVRERLRVPPGLTGMWQVSGRSDSSFEQYKRMDLYYVDNWSLLHDVEICLRTVTVVLTARGAS